MKLKKTVFLLAFCASVSAIAKPNNQANSEEQYFLISACLDDNTAAECLDEHPEWANDPQLKDALIEQAPSCGTDSECEGIAD